MSKRKKGEAPTEEFEEIPGGLKQMVKQIADVGGDCVGVLILHNPEDGTWSYSTNLDNTSEVIDMMNELSDMLIGEISNTAVH